MRHLLCILPFTTLLSSGACTEAGVGVAPLGAQQEAPRSPSFFATAVEHLAHQARGRMLVDPRPVRPGADLRSIEDEDLAPDATPIIQLRSRVLAEHGIAPTDAMVDQRCTFSGGVGLPPGRVVSDSIRRQAAECDARVAYTTFILTIPERVSAGEYPPGTWSIRVHAMDKGGFSIWDLYLHDVGSGQWKVFAAERRFVIWS